MNHLTDLLKKDEPIIDIVGRVCHHKIRILYALCKHFDLKRYCEIGVHNGSSMSYAMKGGAITCVGIDPFEKLVTKQRSMIHYQCVDKITKEKTLKNLERNNVYGTNIVLYDDYSNNVDPTKIKDFDLLFIDGDHSVKAVTNDYNRFKSVICKGGFIVFDDLDLRGNPIKVFNTILKNDKDVELYGIYENTVGILRVK